MECLSSFQFRVISIRLPQVAIYTGTLILKTYMYIGAMVCFYGVMETHVSIETMHELQRI